MISFILNKRVVFLVGVVVTPFWKSVTINLIMTTKYILSIMLLFSACQDSGWGKLKGVCPTHVLQPASDEAKQEKTVWSVTKEHTAIWQYTLQEVIKAHRRSKTNWPVWAITAVRKFNLQQEDVLTEAANLYLGLTLCDLGIRSIRQVWSGMSDLRRGRFRGNYEHNYIVHFAKCICYFRKFLESFKQLIDLSFLIVSLELFQFLVNHWKMVKCWHMHNKSSLAKTCPELCYNLPREWDRLEQWNFLYMTSIGEDEKILFLVDKKGYIMSKFESSNTNSVDIDTFYSDDT